MKNVTASFAIIVSTQFLFLLSPLRGTHAAVGPFYHFLPTATTAEKNFQKILLSVARFRATNRPFAPIYEKNFFEELLPKPLPVPSGMLKKTNGATTYGTT